MLNLLASAIPGLRDLRAPLVAGYVWLLVVWLAIQPATPLAAHTTGIARSLVDLGHTVGPAATAAAVTVTAYVIGAISVSLPSMFSRAIASAIVPRYQVSLGEIEARLDSAERLTGMADNAAEGVTKTAEKATEADERLPSVTEFERRHEYLHSLAPRRPMGPIRRRLSRLLWRLLAPLARRIPGQVEAVVEYTALLGTWRELIAELESAESTPEGLPSAGPSIPPMEMRARLWRIASAALDAGPTRPPELQDVGDTLAERWGELSARQISDILDRADALGQQLRREVNLPNTLLVGEQPEIYAEADRVRSEAEFRLALVLPTIALVIVLVVVGTPWWVFGFLAPAALLATGLAKRNEARTFIVNSIESGKTPSPAARRFKEYATRRLGLTDSQPKGAADTTPTTTGSDGSA